MANVKLLFLCTCFIIQRAYTQLDTSVCTGQSPSPTDPPGPPPLPNAFEIHLEANINNRNYTVTYHAWYNYSLNMVVAQTNNAGNRFEYLYRFDTNELFNVDRDRGLCTVSPITRGSRAFLFANFGTGDKATMKSPSDFLRFNMTGVQEKWINKTMVRGINCDLWRSCVYMSRINATMIVDWYFSSSEWTTYNLSPQLPVRAHVYGKSKMANGQSRSFDHMYEFATISTSSQANYLQSYMTPQGVYCPRATNTKALPQPTSSFHFTAEILFNNYMSMIREWYDSDMNLVRYDYDPLGDTTFGTKPLTQVHDFNTGVAYVIDQLRGNCTATPIGSGGFDVRNADPAHVRIRTSQEFFYFDKASYIYEGQRMVRNILTDVWIAQRNDWPTPGSPNSTWEWYFATPQYSANLPDSLSFGMPVRMVLDAGLGQHYIYNIYAYDERRPLIWSYDISNCFNYTAKKDYSFLLPGSFSKLVNGNMELFRYAVIQAVVKAGSVNNMNLSPLRINNIQIDYADNNDIIVQFTLLDQAPQIGDVSNPKPENSLAVVAKAISGAVNSGQLIVKLDTGTATNMVARQYSLTPGRIIKDAYYQQTVQGASTSTGVSGGAMAGMGVALLVVFFIIGVAATYFYYRRQGGAFGPKKFEDTDITSSTT